MFSVVSIWKFKCTSCGERRSNFFFKRFISLQIPCY